MNPQDSLLYLTRRLRQLRNYILFNNVGTGLAIVLTAASAILIVGWLFNLIFWLTPTFRTSFVVLAGAWLVGLFVATILFKLVRQPSEQAVALRVEKTYPQLHNRLIASLQLEKNLRENREGFSTDMIQAVMNQSQSVCRDLDFKRSVSKAPFLKWSRFFAASALLLAAIAVLFPGSFNESMYLYSHPAQKIERQLTYNLTVTPEGGEVAKFSSLNIDALVSGTGLPEKAVIYWRYPGGDVKKVDLAPLNSNTHVVSKLGEKLSAADSVKFTYNVREVRRSFEYWVQAGDIASQVYTINVVDKPRVVGMKLTYDYPKYTGLEPLVVDENDGNISAIKGTTVRLLASLNKPVRDGWLQFGNNTSSPLELDKHTASAIIKVVENNSYHVAVVDSLDHRNVKPIEYRIESIADLYPEVDIIRPGVPVDLDDNMALDLGIRLFDDFGFSKINLVYRVYTPYGENFEVKTPLSFDHKSGRDFELDYHWDMNDIGLEPGGYVEYLVEAYDNDDVSGPKRGLSQTLTARLPSLDEMFSYLEDQGNEQISTLEKLQQQQQKLSDQMQQLQDQLLTNQNLDWETRKDIENSLQSQQELMKAMDNVQKNMQQMQDKMQKNDLTSLEIMQKLDEIKKLFDQVATPEMKEAMRKLQEALQQMDPEELRKAAEEMQMSQEDLKERLDRTLALLKMLQIQQKMESMTQQLEQLIEQQKQVNNETDQKASDKLPDVAPKEDKNTEQFEKLQKQADELTEMLKEMNLDKQPAAQGFCNAPKKSDAGKHMKRMSDKLSQQDKSESQKSGKEALNSLQKLLDDMNEKKNSFNSNMGTESAEKMKKAFDDLLYVSDKQEDVFDQTEQVAPNSPQLQTLASEQQALERTLQSLKEQMSDLSKESPFFQDQITKLVDQAKECMGNSTNGLTQRNGASAMRQQKDAMFSLNQAANQMLQSLQSQKMCNSGSCSNPNMFKKMGKLAKQQQKINSQSQSMCNNPNKPGNGKASMRQLAGEQGSVQKSLEELKKEQGNRREILGRLDELAKETQKIVESLENGNLDENTLEAQNKIHSRMLDFQRSLERQDYKEERQAEAGVDVPRTSPGQLELNNAANKNTYQDRLQRYLKEKFPEEYEELVKEYFRAVNGRQDNK